MAANGGDALDDGDRGGQRHVAEGDGQHPLGGPEPDGEGRHKGDHKTVGALGDPDRGGGPDGFGAGAGIDGQVLVWSDMCGFFTEFRPKFVKRYLDGAALVKGAVREYAREVKDESFPSEEFEYRQ